MAAVKQVLQLVVTEAGEAKVKAGLLQVGEFERQQFLVPAGIDGNAVVGKHQRPALRLRQTRQHDGRHGFHVEFSRRQHAAMTGNQRAILGNQHRVGEAEGADRPGNLGHLRIRMCASIARIGHQLIETAVFDGKLAGGNAKVSSAKISCGHTISLQFGCSFYRRTPPIAILATAACLVARGHVVEIVIDLDSPGGL